jgi:hypothetical protein
MISNRKVAGIENGLLWFKEIVLKSIVSLMRARQKSSKSARTFHAADANYIPKLGIS